MAYSVERIAHRKTKDTFFSLLSTKKGFTLAEILVSVAIATFIFIAIYAVLNIANISWFTDMGMLDLQQEARLAMDGMTREIRQSSSGKLSITNGGEEAEFSIPNVSGNITYYLNSTNLTRKFPTVSPSEKIIAHNVTSLNFSSSADVVTLQLGLEKIVQKRDLAFSLKEKVRLRNE